MKNPNLNTALEVHPSVHHVHVSLLSSASCSSTDKSIQPGLTYRLRNSNHREKIFYKSITACVFVKNIFEGRVGDVYFLNVSIHHIDESSKAQLKAIK
jgi:hypothetical protein